MVIFMTNKTRKSKEPITVIMYPVDDREKLVKSQANVMLDILEKQLGHDGLVLVMEQLKQELKIIND